MRIMALQVTCLTLSQLKLVRELLCSLAFITGQLFFKVQPVTHLWEFFYYTLQRFFFL